MTNLMNVGESAFTYLMKTMKLYMLYMYTYVLSSFLFFYLPLPFCFSSMFTFSLPFSTSDYDFENTCMRKPINIHVFKKESITYSTYSVLI